MKFKVIVAGKYFQFKSSYLDISASKESAKRAQQTREHYSHLLKDFGIQRLKTEARPQFKERRNLSRARNNFKLLAHTNATRYSKFITLTSKEIMSLDDFRASVRLFIQWLNRSMGEKLKYIGTYELQERGAPHLHLITFNQTFIDFEKALELWRTAIKGVGSVQIKAIKGEADLTKHISYLVSYINHQSIVAFREKSIIRSNGLEKPKVYQNEIPTLLKDTPLKIDYSRLMGSEATDNIFEHIYGYIQSNGEAKIDDFMSVGFVSAERIKIFQEKKRLHEGGRGV